MIAGLAILLVVSLAGLLLWLAEVTGPERPLSPYVIWLTIAIVTSVAIGASLPRELFGVEANNAEAQEPRRTDWRVIANALPVGFALYDAGGNLIFRNAQWQDVFPEEQGAAAPRPGECRLPGGGLGRIVETALSNRDRLFLLEDLTARRLADEEARADQETLRLAASSAGGFVWESDPLHRFAAIAAVRARPSDNVPEWAIGYDIHAITAAEDAAAAQSVIEDLRSHRAIRGQRLTLERQGQTQTIWLNGVPRFDEGGLFLGYCGIGGVVGMADIHPVPRPFIRPAPESRRILLVDDSNTNRMLGLSILKKIGYEADTANDGREAVEALREGDYGLVLMDISMPEMDGLQATAAIREFPDPVGGVPIIAMTGHADRQDRERCLAGGMDEHIAKPIDRKRLAGILERFLRPGEAAAGVDIFGASPAPQADAENSDVSANAILVDDSVLAQLRQDAGASLTGELIDAFMAETDERLERMTQAIDAGDLTAVAAEAHAMKSSSGTFGAPRLQAAATELEAAAKKGAAEDTRSLLDSLPNLVANSWRAFGAAGYPHGS